MKKENKKSNVFIIILFALIIVVVLFFPKIYGLIENINMPHIYGGDTSTENSEKTIDSDLLESLHYPLMRNSIYSDKTYYSLDSFTIKNMSNEDILYNAFLDMYEGNIVDSNVWGECVTSPKEFNSEYIELRIKNILGKNVSYTLDDFKVPLDSKSKYKGTWTYDNSKSRYIYNAYCSSTSPKTQYYDLEEYIKAEYDNNDIVVYYYVGFAKVEKDSFTIYSDPDMKNDLMSGTFTDKEQLLNIFKNINSKNKKIYKYTFKNTLCSYDEYCLYKGEYINGI